MAQCIGQLLEPRLRALRADLEYWEKQQGHPLEYPEKSKSYLLYRWADTLVHHPRVLDAVEVEHLFDVGEREAHAFAAQDQDQPRAVACRIDARLPAPLPPARIARPLLAR